MREALRKLAPDGVLSGLDIGGYLLRRPERQEIIDLYECSAVLEGLCARRVAGTLTTAQMSTLADLLAETEQALDADDFARVYELNSEFHRLVLAAAANQPLRRMLDQLTRQVEYARVTLLRAAAEEPSTRGRYARRLRRDLDDHRDLLRVLAAGDGARAEQRARKHIHRTAQALIT